MRIKRLLLPAVPLAALALALVAAPDASAQFGLGEAVKGTGIPTGTSIPSIIASLLRAALGFVGTLFLLLMVYAGFLWMTARGDSKKVDQAKQLITGAIIGVVLIASAYAITGFVLTALTNTTAGESSSPVAGEQCAPRSCMGASDCNVPGSGCYTGTCICPDGNPGNPCASQGSCGLANP